MSSFFSSREITPDGSAVAQTGLSLKFSIDVLQPLLGVLG